jgi:hypothetical protein
MGEIKKRDLCAAESCNKTGFPELFILMQWKFLEPFGVKCRKVVNF